ncbi:Plasmodium exported protein, unknown function [Plasmodium gallinaceum]|uniref:Ring-exported protein 3 n=1 Tax=Plasmodium gallinaceum TaxID=5849 RepID=A0A1J1GXZ6_PLAGA|nr:Plasmodium exported protein, unknown function [Plasmodium gallinaceum]CRG97174.1 Plasmodium exported protein, unknown function [Plasmodium gallinaceum]
MMFSKNFIIYFFSLLFLLLHCMHDMLHKENLRLVLERRYVRILAENNREDDICIKTQNKEEDSPDEVLDMLNEFIQKVEKEWEELNKMQKFKDSELKLMLTYEMYLSASTEEYRENLSEYNDLLDIVQAQNEAPLNEVNQMFCKWKSDLKDRIVEGKIINWQNVVEDEWNQIKEKKMQNTNDRSDKIKQAYKDWLTIKFPSFNHNFEW